nr:hypothetical protein [Tanacetum cinerariifolium]
MIGGQVLNSFCVNHFECKLLKEWNPTEQSRLGIFLSKEIFEGGMIRIHNAFVHDEDCTDSKVDCIAHELKGQISVGGNRDWSFSQFSFECFKSFNTLFGEKEWGIFFKETSHRPGYLQKVFYEPSIEAGMTKKATDTLNSGGMRLRSTNWNNNRLNDGRNNGLRV